MLLAGLKPVVSDKIVKNCDPGSQLPPRPSQVPPLNLSSMIPNGYSGKHRSPRCSPYSSPSIQQSSHRNDRYDEHDKDNPQVSEYLSFENLSNDEKAWENLGFEMLDKVLIFSAFELEIVFSLHNHYQ